MSVEVGDWEETEGSLLTFRTPELGNFEILYKKALYMICVKALNLRALDKVIESNWIGVAEQGFPRKVVGGPCTRSPLRKDWVIFSGGLYIGQ